MNVGVIEIDDVIPGWRLSLAELFDRRSSFPNP